MMVLGPHGVAEDITASYAAAANGTLTRGLAASWLYGAFLAARSTVGALAPAPAVPSDAAAWADLAASDRFYANAWRCADAGFATPAPRPGVRFRPRDPMSPRDWAGWVARAFHPRVPGSGSAATTLSRGEAAAVLYHAAMDSHTTSTAH